MAPQLLREPRPRRVGGALNVDVAVAAQENALWCHLVCRVHRMRGVFADDAWTCARRTPKFYPDAVTLRPAVDEGALLARIDCRAGASVKDSFADLDLSHAGFDVLFDAQWIAHQPPGERNTIGDALQWKPTSDPADLRAWDFGMRRKALFAQPSVMVLVARVDGRFVAGAIAHCPGDVVGVSNVSTTVDPNLTWATLRDQLGWRFPGRPIVGYERDDALDAARNAGFEPLGPLRVWIAQERGGAA